MSKKPFDMSLISVILGLVFIAIVGIRTISTPEIWTHLAQGRDGAPLSYLAVDNAVNTTYLYDKITYGLWKVGGAPALTIVNILLLLAAFALLTKVSSKWGGTLSQGFALLLCGHLIFQDVDVGPQSVMMLFIALFVFLLTTLKKPAHIFGILIPLQILWTNLDGSFLFGPVLAVLAAFQAWRTAAKSSNRKKTKNTPVKTLWALSAALFVATLINPYFIKLHTQVVANIMHPTPIYWTTLLRDYFLVPTQKPLIFFSLILGAGGLITLKKNLPIMLTTLAIVGAFLAWTMPQTVRLFVVLSMPFIVLSFSAIGESLQGAIKPLMGKQKKLLIPITHGVLIILIIASIVPITNNCAYARIGSTSSFGFGTQDELYPNEIGTLLNNDLFPDKILNIAADGGYLAFNYNKKIFIDYRPGRYPVELLKDFNNMMRGNHEAYDRLFDEYRPEALIINTLNPATAQGIASLLYQQIWKLAYFDGTTAVLLLNKPELVPLFTNIAVQEAGLKKLETARAKYAEKVGKGCYPGCAPELIGSGSFFLALHRPEQSEAIFSLLLQRNSSVPSAWIGLGNSQLMLKKFDESVASLKTAIELVPNSILAWASYEGACRYANLPDEQKRAHKKVKELIEKSKEDAPEEIKPPTVDKPETNSTSLLDASIPE